MSTRGQSKVNLLTVIIAAVLGLGVGFGLVVFTSRDAPEEPDLASMADVQLEATPDDSSGAADAAAASEPSEASEAAETAESAEGGSGAETVLAACVDAASQAEDAVAAARTSLGNWATHYGAQVAFDKGEITSDEAKRRWAESKAPAQQNIDAFVDARDAVPTDDPCGDAEAEAASDGDQQLAQECSAQLAAFTDVMSATDPAMEDWRGHLKMMATRDQYQTEEYLAIWRQTVADAPGPMRDFEKAAATYDDVGTCAAQG